MAPRRASLADAMNFRVEVDGRSFHLKLDRNEPDGAARCTLEGDSAWSGEVEVAEISPQVFSVLLGHRQLTVYLDRSTDHPEVWIAGRRHAVSLADVRDRRSGNTRSAAAGPAEIQAQMPGRVVKLLVEAGARVEKDQGLLVVEAMKMQNEMKSPRAGTVTGIYVAEGATVAAGEKLISVS